MCLRRFDLPYLSLPLSSELLGSWEHPSEELLGTLALPPRNHYIPTDFAVLTERGEGSDLAQARAAAAMLLQGGTKPTHKVRDRLAMPSPQSITCH
jgi:hypothetical protein